MKIKVIRSIFFIFAILLVSILVGCSEITAPSDTTAPEAPRNFTLLGGGDGKAHFRWEKNSEIDFKEYRLYRAVNDINAFSLFVSLTATEYVDRFLEYDSIYYYYLTAINYAGSESQRTNIIDVQPLNISAPQPPSRLNVSGINNPLLSTFEIRLSWIPPDIGDLKNYAIYRDNVENFVPDPANFIDSTAVSIYTDRFAQLNTRYYYKVIAKDKGNKISQPSKAATDVILSSPILISPANNVRFGDPKVFKWQGVSGAVHYQVFVGNGPLSNVIWSSNKTTSTEALYAGPTLQTSKVYYWWVAVYSKDKIRFDDGSEFPAQINSFSLVNSFFVE